MMRFILRLILAADRILLRADSTRTVMRLVDTSDLHGPQSLVMHYLRWSTCNYNQCLLHNIVVQEVVIVGEDSN